MSNRSINTFLDTQRLLKGRDFKFDFAKALVKSTVVVPIVSKYALERLISGKHYASSCDNLLLEWIMTLICYEASHSSKRLLGVFPILIGSQADDEIKDLFAEKDPSDSSKSFLSTLSTDIPVATIEVARRLLLENKIPFKEGRSLR